MPHPDSPSATKRLRTAFARLAVVVAVAGVFVGAAVAQDECDTAILITAPFAIGSTFGATTSAVTGRCGAPMGNDVWYTYQPSVSGFVTLSLCPYGGGGSFFDTCLAVFTGTCGSLVEIACNDDFCGTASEVTFMATAGVTYYVAVGGSRGESGFFSLMVTAPPANDVCSGAFAIDLGTTAGSNARTSASGVVTSCGALMSDVWYRHTAASDGVLRASFCFGGGSANFDSVLAVFAGYDCDSLTEVACNDDHCGAASEVTFPVTAGDDYWIAVAGSGGQQGLFQLALQPVPGNDQCTGAIAIGEGITSGSTVAAATSVTVASCAVVGSDVWYTYTAPQDGAVVLSLCSGGASANFDTVLAVFAGGCGALTEIVCSDDTCGALSQVAFVAQAGHTYLIAVGGKGTEQGVFDLGVFTAPTNDECAGALPIVDGSTSGNNLGATRSATTASCGVADSDVWYEYVAAGPGTVTASLCRVRGGNANFDPVLAAFTGSCGGLTEIACSDDHCGPRAQIEFPVTEGRRYWIALASAAGLQGDFTLAVRREVAGNQCTEAIPISEGLTTGTTIGATLWPPVGSCQLAFGNVWYRYVPAASGVVTASFCAPGAYADFDTILTVFSSCVEESFIVCNNDHCGPLSEVVFGAREGTEYLISVAGLLGAEGDFRLSLTRVESPLQFDVLRKRGLPPDVDETTSIVLGDVDLDGDADCVVGNRGENRLYENDGSGGYVDVSATQLPRSLASTSGVALADVDGDGDPDLVCANGLYAGEQDQLFLNDGGRFTEVTATHLPAAPDVSNTAAFGDVDADGDLDLFFGSGTIFAGAQSRLLINTGTGVFADETATRMPVIVGMALAATFVDVESDGDLDLVWVGAGSRLLINDGAGYFTEAPAQLPFGDGEALAALDVEGDGDLDLVVGVVGQNRLLLNDGSGTYADATTGRLPVDVDTTVAIAATDVDGDGDLDLLLGNGSGRYPRSEEQNRLYLNDGAGTFQDVTAASLPPDREFTLSVAAGDVDGDGDRDLLYGVGGVVGSGSENRLLLGRGDGTFVGASTLRFPPDGDISADVAASDVDADGDLDLVLANVQAQNRLYLNQGQGDFVDATDGRMPMDTDWSNAVAAGDVDGDGDDDLVVPSTTPPGTRLYLNDGRGTFADETSGRLPSTGGRDVALVDVDADNDLDVVIARWGTNALWLNDGRGVYTDASGARLPTPDASSMAVAVGDVDGDGDPDLVFGNISLGFYYYGARNGLYLNDGTGAFVDATSQLPENFYATHALALGDVDADRDLDLIATGARGSQIYVNDGLGRFTDESVNRLPGSVREFRAIAFADVDEDGDPDLLLGGYDTSSVGEQNRLLLNDGAGRFVERTLDLPVNLDQTLALALEDLDQDGDLDVVAGNEGPNRVYRNLRRQLAAPLLLRTGRRYRLDVYARSTTPRLGDLAVPYVAGGAASIPVPPWGVWGLDPAVMAPLTPFLIPQPAGVGSADFFVPNDASLVGAEVRAQALLVQYPAGARFTNVTFDLVTDV
ncbi:MAG: VCBS repeat-containing protein [Planctomycetota bacterium]